MPVSVVNYARHKNASKIILSRFLPEVGIDLDDQTDPACAEAVFTCISGQPVPLIRDCCISTLGFEDLGPSARYYPNHGVYKMPDNILVLNKRLITDPPHGIAEDGREISTLEFILAHELGHGWDAAQGQNRLGKDYSLHPDWLSLSDWSETPKPGHRRLRIRERGYPEKVGEWYYGPKAKFCRYYGKMNPWDDWADSFAYYVTGMKNKLPEEKLGYFNERIGSYYDAPYNLSMKQYSPRYASTSSKFDDNTIEDFIKKYPEFMAALIRKMSLKELDRKGSWHGVAIPTFREYLHLYADKDDNLLKRYLGRIPDKEKESFDTVLSEFLEKQKPTFTGEPTKSKPGIFKKFFKGVKGGEDMSSFTIRLANHVDLLSDKLEDMGYYWKSVELKQIGNMIREAKDCPEEFNIGTDGFQIKSIEEYIEDFDPKAKDKFFKSLESYKKYLKDIQEDITKKIENRGKIDLVFKEAFKVIDDIVNRYKRPIPGEFFKDPITPTKREMTVFISSYDNKLKSIFEGLKNIK